MIAAFFGDSRGRTFSGGRRSQVVSGLGLGLDAVAHGQLHPGRDDAGGDLQIHVVVVDPGDGGLQTGRGVHAVADLQRVVQVDRGLHLLPLPPRREEHEGTHDQEQRQEDDQIHDSENLSFC